MGFKNSTTNFAQSWGSTQGRLLRVEVLVLFSALIWILIELLGSRRRRHSHGFFRFFVWMVYTLFTVIGPYTIGLLQDGPFRDQTFVLWGTILLLIQVSVDSLSVYSIHDIEQRKRMLVQQVFTDHSCAMTDCEQQRSQQNLHCNHLDILNSQRHFDIQKVWGFEQCEQKRRFAEAVESCC